MLNMFNAFLQLLFDILATYYLAKGMTDKRMPWLVFMYVSLVSKRNASMKYSGLQTRDGTSIDKVRAHLLRTFDNLSDKNLNSHIVRAFFNLSYETMEVTGPQMVLVMKLTTFAWNVYDGRRSAEVSYPPIKTPFPSLLTRACRNWINGNSNDE